MIDLDAVVSLRAVAERGSVVGAADALGFTPSAVSQQVKRLERAAGVALLERVGRGVILTSAGRRLIDESTELFARLERLESGLRRDAAVVSGRLRLLAFSTALRGLIAPMAPALIRQFPALRLEINEGEPWETVEAVASGRHDLGVVHRWGQVPVVIPAHVAVTELCTDVADLIVPAGHPLTRHRYVTPQVLGQTEWVATPEGTICRQWLNRMYDGTQTAPNVRHIAVDFDTHLAMVGAGLGVALVPRLGRSPLADDVVAIEVRDPAPTRTVQALHRRTMDGNPAVIAVLGALKRAGSRSPGPA